jgi:SAM-dependent methyltransferase
MINPSEYFASQASNWLYESYGGNPTVAQIRARLAAKMVEKYRSPSVIDIGCGDGRLLESMTNCSSRVGVDRSDEMLNLARSRCPDLVLRPCDLDKKDSITELYNLGKFDVMFMLGVVHYLVDPLDTLSALKPLLHNASSLVLSFRNRLFNANRESRYHLSDLTQSDLCKLETEIKLWETLGDERSSISRRVRHHQLGSSLLHAIQAGAEVNGVTDDFWNPKKLRYWRQFTPLSALALLEAAGFEGLTIIPTGGDLQTQRVSGSEKNSALELLRSSPAFVCLAEIRKH